jgi:N-acetylglucosaminyldiphosphoundecaprenol N-acetyl-beta-D-mannosaminyltransferase
MIKSTTVLNTDISETTIEEVSDILTSQENISVAICNANSLVRSVKNTELKNAINSFEVKTPDGFPVAKALSILSKKKFERVDGYKVFLKTIEKGLDTNISHFFFGNNEKVVTKLINKLKKDYPSIVIGGYICPPMLDVNQLISDYGNQLSNLDSKIIWISLGLPKQELFMKKLKDSYELTHNLIGVGGVFDWVAGTKKKAPEWAANLGLEWILRLVQEPRRLAKRYFVDNFLFIVYFIKQFFSKSKTL